MIDASLLGPVQLSVNGGAAPPGLLWRKHLALLVYLACSPRRSRSREHLTGLLWPEKPEPAARRSLTVALSLIRHVVGEQGLGSRPDPVTLAPGVVRLDIERFEQCVAAGDWRGAADLAGGAFMEGFSLPESTRMEEWLSAERRRWGERVVDALLHLAAQELDTGRSTQAAEVAARALAVAPLSEPAMVMLMRALAVNGETALALQEYDRFAARLAEEVGTQPSAGCQAMADRLRNDRGPRVPRPEAGVPERRRAPLVGRGAELASLWQAWLGCRASGRCGVGLVLGDPGTGKSRLAEEIVARARLEGATTAVMRAVAGDQETADSLVLALARGGLLGAPGLAGARSDALARLAALLPDWADRFPAAQRAAATVEVSLGQALIEVVRAGLVERPVLLAVDDAEYLDDASLRLLALALRDLAGMPLFLLCSTLARAPVAELDALRSRIGRDVEGAAVHLEPLTTADIRVLAHWAVPEFAEAEVDRLTRRVATDSAGLPLLVVELLSAVAAGLDMGQLRGAWPAPFETLDQSLPGDLPDAVVAAIRVEFRRRRPDARLVLQAASVLDPPLTAARLAHATGLEPPAVTEALDELEWSRWLVVDGRGYAYLARIVRQVVEADLVLPGERQRFRDAAGAG